MVIFTGTGRSGTGLYAKLFDAHHEFRVPELVKAFGPDVRKPLPREPFGDLNRRKLIMRKHLEGVALNDFRDSSNPYILFIDALYEMFPDIKIVFGVRDGRDFAISGITRCYHDMAKYGYVHAPPEDDPSFEKWFDFDPLEKMAWLWKYRNNYAMKMLEPLPDKNKLFIRLEDITNKNEKVSDLWIQTLENFVGRKANKEWLKVKYNCNDSYDFLPKENWSEGQKDRFNAIAGDLMAKFGYLDAPAISAPDIRIQELLLKAEEAVADKKYARALSALDELAGLAGSLPDLKFSRAQCLAELEFRDLAIKAAEAELSEHPENEDCRNWLSEFQSDPTDSREIVMETAKKEEPQPIEHVIWHEQHIATIIRRDYLPIETTFISPDSYYQQAGFVVYPKGGVVPRHQHLPLQRHLMGTPETLIIRKGRVDVELYAMDKSFLGTWELVEGDIILLVAGGHCFTCQEDTVFFEIKQGPYTGLVEKEKF